MSWLFSQVLVEEYLEGISSDGEQSVQSNGNRTQQAYCAPDKMTDFSRLSRFGMMFKPLTGNRGEELLTLYLADFHVKTSPQQEEALELTESDLECGEKWRGSFTKYNPDSRSWKTHQCSLLGGLDEFLETWPRWGLMRNGECWEQPMSAHRISATESGLWASPNARDWKDTGSNQGKRKSPNLGTQVHWPTPQSRDYKGSSGRSLKGLETDLPTKVGGKLNPTWVEWLMGWPLGWTDLKPLETDRFQKWLEQHGTT